MENKSAIGVALYRFFSWSDFRCSDSRASSLPRLLRLLGDGGELASSNQPSANRRDFTRSKLTSSTGALNVTPLGPAAVACFLLEDPRRTRLDSFSRTLGSRMLGACASSHSDGIACELARKEYGLLSVACGERCREIKMIACVFSNISCLIIFVSGMEPGWRSSEVSGGNCGECGLMRVAPDKNDWAIGIGPPHVFAAPCYASWQKTPPAGFPLRLFRLPSAISVAR